MIYFVNTTNHNSSTGSGTGGAGETTCMFTNSSNVTDRNNMVWISNPASNRYLDIVAIGI